MTEQNDRLKKLLMQCRDREPLPDFDKRVWSRIDATRPSSLIRGSSLLELLLGQRMVFARAVALLIGASVGLAIMGSLPRSTMATAGPEMSIFRQTSLTGSYHALITGETSL